MPPVHSKPKDDGGKTKWVAEEVINKSEAGDTVGTIAKALGVSKSTVKRDRRHHRATGEARKSRQQLDLLERVKEAGDAEDLLPAYRTLCDVF